MPAPMRIAAPAAQSIATGLTGTAMPTFLGDSARG